MAGRRPFPSAPEPTVSYAPDSVPSPEKRSRWLPATALTCGEAPSGAWGPVPSPLALTRVQRPLPANFISFQNVGPANSPRAWGISSPCTWAQPPGAGHVRGAVLAPGSLAGDRLALDADGATRQARTASARSGWRGAERRVHTCLRSSFLLWVLASSAFQDGKERARRTAGSVTRFSACPPSSRASTPVSCCLKQRGQVLPGGRAAETPSGPEGVRLLSLLEGPRWRFPFPFRTVVPWRGRRWGTAPQRCWRWSRFLLHGEEVALLGLGPWRGPRHHPICFVTPLRTVARGPEPCGVPPATREQRTPRLAQWTPHHTAMTGGGFRPPRHPGAL